MNRTPPPLSNQADSQRARRRRAHRHRSLNGLAHDATHDFRGILTVISEYVSLFQDGLCGAVNDEQRRVLQVLDDRTDDLNRMVDDLFDLSKLHTNQMSFIRRNCRVSEIMDRILPAVAKKATMKGLEITCDIEADLQEVYCDPEPIGRALTNLASNAIKSCRPSGRIRLWAHSDESSRAVVIGVGENRALVPETSADDRVHSKNPLANSPAKPKSFRPGILIARKLIALNFGKLVESTALRDGSSASFDIPFADSAEVLRRYLTRLARCSKHRAVVSAVRAKVQGPDDAHAIHSLEMLFHDCLGPNDLLLHEENKEWVLIVAHGPVGLARYFARLHAARQHVERHEFRGTLPPVELIDIGTWTTAMGTAEIVYEIVSSLSPLEISP